MAPPTKRGQPEKLGVNPLVIVTALVIALLAGVFIWLAMEAQNQEPRLVSANSVPVITVEADVESGFVKSEREASDEASEKAVEEETAAADTERGETILEQDPASEAADDDVAGATDVLATAEPDQAAPSESDQDVTAVTDYVTAAEPDREPAAETAETSADEPALTGTVDKAGEKAVDGAPAVPLVEIPLKELLEQAGIGALPVDEAALAALETPEVIGAVPAAPDAALLEATSSGELPVIAEDGREAWQAYARPFPLDDPRPRIAIVLTGLGLSQAATNAAIKLPGAVTLSFAPYAANLPEWTTRARAAGHEIMLDLPMEPINYPTDDPGPHTLLTSLNPSDNVARLEWLLSRFAGYVGVIDQMGSKFARSDEALRPVLGALKSRGLMVLDSGATPDSRVFSLARQINLASAANDSFLDDMASREAIDRHLAGIEERASATGYAIGVGRPFPVTIERIAVWVSRLEQRGFAIAPVSAIVNRQAVE